VDHVEAVKVVDDRADLGEAFAVSDQGFERAQAGVLDEVTEVEPLAAVLLQLGEIALEGTVDN
jgi:hypothetical protein